MTTEIEQAEAAVRQAEGEYRELERAAAMLRDRLPAAQQELESARAQLRRLKQEDGTAATLCQQREIDRLTAAIAAANEDRSHA
ncbi:MULTISPECIES: hypothetical protein [Pseudomonas]|uniref:Chromosome segregation ATPase n=1 Tax=Pseudomonas putida NBRC 14164 TaxID=1211579 RepID=A0ABM7EEB6_PSEPU|nr:MULTISPECIES: hypothetical protein [Pseudomonas]MCX9135594.1 hypothetical protein [Pseudomonas sp. DCB_PUT]MDD1969587.1 hypothetical protein [Pseudomonas putida]MDO1464817.1 hypothetical protein [Pseudomonas putida]MDO1470187.1 hypothetical protein [Pseudomonas putida]MDZ7325903.1 hypothetical protein [Pseudomonas sp. SDS3-8]